MHGQGMTAGASWAGGRLPRDNNFDLIRLGAALQVVLAHTARHNHITYPDWFSAILYLFPGVPIFFFVSGLLVASSLASRPLADYAASRCRRVFPALWFALVLAIIMLALFGQIGVTELRQQSFWIWIATQLSFLQVFNPAMFRDFGVGTVNGSLWTIPVEIGFYLALPVLTWACAPSKRRLSWALAIGAMASLGLSSWFVSLDDNLSLALKVIEVSPVTHFWLFAMGSLAYLHFDRLHALFSRIPAVLPLGAYLVYGLVIVPFMPEWLSRAIGYPLLCGAVFSLATVARSCASILRGQDLSYGIYLFHMLAINAVREAGLTGWIAALPAWMATLAAALLSWNLIERRMIGQHRSNARSAAPAIR